MNDIRRVNVAFGVISSDGAAKELNEHPHHHESLMLFKFQLWTLEAFYWLVIESYCKCGATTDSDIPRFESD